MKKLLNEIAVKHKTDKSSLFNNYCFDYEKFLPFNREEKLTILEIGVGTGASLRMWSEFYPNSLVIGIDITDKLWIPTSEDKNIKVVLADQSIKTDLESVSKKYGPFNLIIDDGSHKTKHQLISFEYFINHLKEDGVYIIEDLITSYWNKYIQDNFSMVDYLKTLIDDLNHQGVLSKEDLNRTKEKLPCVYKRKYDFKNIIFTRFSCIILK